MKLFEYQAKELFRKYGIPVPRSSMARNGQEAREATEQTGLPCMIKAQVLAGGRGKMGLVKRAETTEEAARITEEMLVSPHGVSRVLTEECIVMQNELYLSIGMDAERAQAVILACAEGGVDIESLVEQAPEKILREYIDLDRGLQNFQVNDLLYSLGVPDSQRRSFSALVHGLYKCFVQCDAELVEINPVFLTEEGVVAGDGKLIIDDNSLFRHPEFTISREYFDSDMEFAAAQEGIPYIQFDGDISLMCAGAGLTTTVYDLIHYEGGSVANYLEFGGPNYTKGEKAMEICLQNKSKVILIVTFGTIARADIIAEGVVKAWERMRPDRPLVACIRGTGEEKANEMLSQAGIEHWDNTEQAVHRAVALCRKEGQS